MSGCVARERAGRAEKIDPMLGREFGDCGNLGLGRRPRRRRRQLGTVGGLARGDHKGREVAWCANREHPRRPIRFHAVGMRYAITFRPIRSPAESASGQLIL